MERPAPLISAEIRRFEAGRRCVQWGRRAASDGENPSRRRDHAQHRALAPCSGSQAEGKTDKAKGRAEGLAERRSKGAEKVNDAAKGVKDSLKK